MTRKSETVEILKAMRVKLAAGWTTNAAARDGMGLSVNSRSPGACKFCLLGAMWSLKAVDRETDVERALLQTLSRGGLHETLPGYNDAPGRTKEEILALVDKTIERLESAGVSA